MRNIFLLIVCATCINVSCQKTHTIANFEKSAEDTLEKPTIAYFDDDNIEDTLKILARPDNEILNFGVSFNLSTLNKVIEMPVLNNSILYNNDYSAYYISAPIIKNKIVELRVEYAEQITKPNISGEKKDLTEKTKLRFNPKNKKVQIIGYDINYTIDNKNYVKSFNFITGKYFSSSDDKGKKNNSSGEAVELHNIYSENWNRNFLNKLLLYGNEID